MLSEYIKILLKIIAVCVLTPIAIICVLMCVLMALAFFLQLSIFILSNI